VGIKPAIPRGHNCDIQLPNLGRRLGGDTIGLDNVMRLDGDVMRLGNMIRLDSTIRLNDVIRFRAGQ